MDAPDQHRSRSLILVLCCTVLGAAAQILFKTGAERLSPPASLGDMALRVITSPTLFFGYALYGISTILLVLALRHGQLSLLYPVFALTYVWVMILSVMIFHDSVNVWKVAGVATIVGGVSVLGRSSSA